MTSRLALIAAPLLVVVAIVSGCSSGNGDGSGNSTPSASAVPSTSTAARSSSTDSTTGATVSQVDPNTASESQIAAAFTAAGVANADKWAKEVTEYGPYTPDTISDTLTKELGKYGIDQQTLHTILGVLAPQ
ncbi:MULTISPECIES: hypothetical protein [unclassified Rhodococcus (in: high G+C Gram-positive bacteria)]|uniref:hypothetical protein n=1 Tax=unclassified Rhodococcus (in: high G+C Gram-positive bacteria) TaxID=192944 RepID=UPI00163B5C07|nr:MULTISPECIES: hypothetical protein [unclassified Rhodococcus (in: high G+C Gram-positive bacteria)]MBC2638273.1 hypothetical protein [Rhodococcus sp. 3A]MBC2896986.1 hypothetical protein [Rhodococcus sp. 4CII]